MNGSTCTLLSTMASINSPRRCFHGFAASEDDEAILFNRIDQWMKFVNSNEEVFSDKELFSDKFDLRFWEYWTRSEHDPLVDEYLVKAIDFLSVDMLLKGIALQYARKLAFQKHKILPLIALKKVILRGCHTEESATNFLHQDKDHIQNLKNQRDIDTDSGLVRVLTKDLPCSCLDGIKEQYVDKSNPRDICHNCGVEKPKLELLVCSRCKIILYCSKACHVKDWQEHKRLGCFVNKLS
jgi:hypothetical protein